MPPTDYAADLIMGAPVLYRLHWPKHHICIEFGNLETLLLLAAWNPHYGPATFEQWTPVAGWQLYEAA